MYETSLRDTWLLYVSDNYLNFGTLGVGLFFLISGYVVPQSILNPTKKPIIRFVISRTFRLFPAYWVSMIFAYLIFHIGSRDLLANATMHQRFFGIQDALGVYWTLQIELVFYYLIGLLLLLNIPMKVNAYKGALLAFGFLSILTAFVRMRYGIKAPMAPFIGLTIMLSGTMIFFFQRGTITRASLLSWASLSVASLSIASLMGYQKDWGHKETPSRFIVTYAACAVLFFLGKKFQAVSTSKILVVLGTVSYSIYLFHQIVKEFLMPVLTGEHWFIIVAANAAVTISWSYVVYRFFELPLIRLGKRFSGWIETSST